MTLSFVEVLALSAAGYVTGMSICSGFILSALKQLYVHQQRLRVVAWTAVAILNIVLCSLSSIFLVVFLVYRDNPSGPIFWSRMFIFGSGVVLGGSFCFTAVRLFNSRLQQKPNER